MEKNLKDLEKIIDYNFKKKKLLEKALTHKSLIILIIMKN